MKKLLLILGIICFLPFSVYAKNDLVKVYVFEAGGCPYCEKEIEYLKGLDSYNKKFEIVEKETFVDHVDWEEGKDFELAKKVAETFQDAGYADAVYEGTPFVIISDIYALTSYSEDLEQYIDQAYEEGDNDAVSCIQNDEDNCVRIVESTNDTTEIQQSNESISNTMILILICTIIIVSVYLVKSTLDRNKIIKSIKEK